MCTWVFLAFRDERLIGAGGRLEDARQLCEAKAAEMHEAMGREDWRAPETVGGRAGDPHRGELVARRGPYAIRRVPVARYGEAC